MAVHVPPVRVTMSASFLEAVGTRKTDPGANPSAPADPETARRVAVADALAPAQLALVQRIARLQEYTKSKTVGEAPAGASPVEAHANVCQAGVALAQQSRAFFFLMQDGTASPEDARGVGRDLIKAVEMYDSWVGSLLSGSLPVVRKAAGGPCCLVLQTLSSLISRSVNGQAVAHDVGRIQAAVDELPKLQTSGARTAEKLVREAAQLVNDALREVREAVAEANSGMNDDEDEDDEEELLASEAISAPLDQLVSDAVDALILAADEGLAAASNATLALLITCAQAVSTCTDSTVASAHEDDVAGVTAHARSLAKVLKKMLQILAAQCALEAHPTCVRLAGTIDKALAELTAACEQLQAAEGMGGLKIG